ncbi:hypothetical protein LUZ61_010450 [Rhynchospora tenuis]|uniref:AT-hook motif nuclear-localized protein n=1 Tax=Rhynchospora tenuis TaxID=198213 RepID=A0AAD5ZZ92_9POAL|nr:hypothetical protein LUZ61_010450 [Rhynchospora tenuis]
MDSHENMPMSCPSSFYYNQTDFGGQPNAGTSSHTPAVPLQSVPTPGSSFLMQSSMNHARAESHQYFFHSGSHPILVQTQDVPVSTDSGPIGTEPVKKKRGRPKKYDPEAHVGLPSAPQTTQLGASGGSTKRRGRPPGTGTKQQLQQLGEWLSGSAGMGFTPHAVRIAIGEDISSKVMSFSQHGPRAVCILSANGAVSTVTLCQNSPSGGTVTYEGCFEILSLSGSYMIIDTDNGARRRTGGLCISLSSPDGRVFGGNVGGALIAASPIQVIVGSFMYSGAMAKDKTKESIETGQPGFEFVNHIENHFSTPQSSALSDHNASTLVWSSGETEIQSGRPNIDLTRG